MNQGWILTLCLSSLGFVIACLILGYLLSRRRILAYSFRGGDPTGSTSLIHERIERNEFFTKVVFGVCVVAFLIAGISFAVLMANSH